MRTLLLHSCLLISFFCRAQKIPDIAVLSFVKSKHIILRWAPGKFETWKIGNQSGYKIERIPFDDFKSMNDYTNSTLVNSTLCKPWAQNDERWSELIKKNKSAALLFSLLYKSTAAASTVSKDMMLGMILKSCDLHPEMSMAAGLYLADSTFTAGEIYVYRISFGEIPKTVKYEAGMATANSKEKNVLPSLKPISARFFDKKVEIKIPTSGTERDFSGFWIDRSEDSVNYKTVNKAPLVHTITKNETDKIESIYLDSLPKNGKKYFYRVRGISYFGGSSEPSNIISGKGKTPFTDYPLIGSINVLNNKVVRLKFRMPEKFDMNELKGFAILRSETKKGKYINLTPNILPKTSTDFTDLKPGETNYYKICALNLELDSSFSFTANAKLTDEIPPAAPDGVVGKIDTSGAVSLSWNANCETDILGYRVFRCNNEKEKPVEITKRILTETKFTDKVNLQTLTKEVYYTVRAVDKVHNNSGYSTLCKLNRPDKIAPVTPLFKQVDYTDSTINISWIPSTSSDVAIYKLLKVDQRANGWRVIKEWHGKDSLSDFIDTTLEIGSTYRYRLEACDDAKNSAYATSPFVSFNPAFVPGIKNFNATLDLSGRSILLQWNAYNDAYSYTLYKAKGDEVFRLYKTLGSKSTSFTDKELYPNNNYRYTIKATLRSGIETKMSKELKVGF